MRREGLITLRAELRADCQIFKEASDAAVAHLREGSHGRLEATAFELARAYNAIEQMCARIARDFENQFTKNGGWHEALLRRMTLDVPGIRPALFGACTKADLDELRRFRHLVHHAYDLSLREDRVMELTQIAGKIAATLESTCETFVLTVASQQGWQL